MPAVLEVKNLKTFFKTERGKVPIVSGVDFSIQAGETVGLVGESGCGKSVTSLSIMRLLAKGGISEGSIRFENRELLTLPEKAMQKIRGNEIAMIFQEPMTSLNPLHTIGRQIEEALRLHTNLNKNGTRLRAIQMLKAVGMPRAEEMYKEFPHQLSGGMRQRVMIAMAMACNPKVIIADEPTTALDVTIQAQILDLMRNLKEETGTAILLITHDLGVVAEMCDRVIVMYAGLVVEETAVQTLFEQPKHPYTVGLLRSTPNIDEEKEYLDTIPGAVPMIHEMPKGCRFAPRCSRALDICHESPPQLIDMGGNHKVRCWLYAEGDEA
ncbi:ABC transporter ATP-binding protein [Fodinisporobacter ferrooxydans]|uniref:ABC transporter ATP-binding protein n=1 Tax=Fodinisporobacter ferrooxydans TaxID=2901836 RepID=A0ABY4CJN5_9BACL|nr:ABC transporter ATP-binding protein [Alicyclobacillaceae bacterium MYW30-H2]